MRAAALALMVLALAGCPNPSGGSNGAFSFVPDPGEAPCTPGGSSARFLAEGMLESAVHYDCEDREAVGGGAEFTAHSGQTTLVAGGSTALRLEATGVDGAFDGELVVAMVSGERGWFSFALTAAPDDAAGSATVELFLRSNAPAGAFELLLGIDDGTGTPDNPRPVAWYAIPFNVIGTAGGALQFALNWDTAQDVDLHVVDPDGEMVYYGNPQSATGGDLDLDSNAGCTIDGVQNENVLWGASAPAGDYGVAVNLWSACGSNTPTQWRLTILQDGVPVDTKSGSLSPADENPEASPLPVVTVFTYAP